MTDWFGFSILRRVVYLQPADARHVTDCTVPYELDVDIVKDCSNFGSEIADVFNVIKKNCDDSALVLKRVTAFARAFLQRHGYGKEVLNGLNGL